MKTILAGVAVLTLLLIAGCAEPEAPAAPPTVKLSDGQVDFALSLYRAAAGKQGNVILSPFSVATAMAMTAEGAGGETARQMHDALGGDAAHQRATYGVLQRWLTRSGADHEMTIANAIWPAEGFKLHPDFVRKIRDSYGGAARPLDFGDADDARSEINDWASDQTDGRIDELVPRGAFDADTRLVLTNAIHFRGAWEHEFNGDFTAPDRFTLTDGSAVKTPMMRDSFYGVAHAQFEGFAMLELPYLGGEIAMLILLPDRHDGLAAVEARLTGEALSDWISQMKPAAVDIRLPKFRIKWRDDLKAALRTLGITDAFNPEAADLGPMNTSSEPLFVDAVYHQGFIDVDEQGTEASASTAVAVAAAAEPPKFHADRPFLFIIREHTTGALLFIGRLMQP
jgi:serpin B